jgi:hypothetical protein
MKWILTLLPGFGSRVYFATRRSISRADGLPQKNDCFLTLIVRLSDKKVTGCLKILSGSALRSDAFTRCSVTPLRALNLSSY